ncbi:MAG: acetylglutamate kinase [Pelagibacterales bacterium]|nr:acetylglutamate kinase [Pelagibacterales bacterium]
MEKEISLEEVKKFWPQSAPNINKIKKYVEKYKNEKIVIKCGGNVLIDPKLFSIFIEDVVILNKLGLTTIIVHGGGPRIQSKLDKLNLQSTFIKGLRVTDKKIIKVVEDVLIEFNKEIVLALNKKSCKSVSINTKNKNVIDVTPEKKELGYVGIPKNINIEIINEIIDKNEIPVLAPMGLDNESKPYNINADIAAGAIAKSLKSRRLLLMTNVEGVYDKNKKLLPELSVNQAIQMMKDEVVVGGMIPKISTCIDAIKNGVRGVVIIDGRKPHSILNEIFSDLGAGTLIR